MFTRERHNSNMEVREPSKLLNVPLNDDLSSHVTETSIQSCSLQAGQAVAVISTTRWCITSKLMASSCTGQRLRVRTPARCSELSHCDLV